MDRRRHALLLATMSMVLPFGAHGWIPPFSFSCKAMMMPTGAKANPSNFLDKECGVSPSEFSLFPASATTTATRDRFVKSMLALTASLAPINSAQAMSSDPKTGIALPDVGEIEASIPIDWTSVENPVEGNAAKSSFSRLDSSSDAAFYADPRFVEHVDDQAVRSMTNYIRQEVLNSKNNNNNNLRILDLCSSWTSHIDLEGIANSNKPQQISGLGMNAKELERNPVLTDWVVRDLNENPTLPYDDNSYDVVLCQLSIDYLTKPLQVLRETSRVLRPGGTVHVLFSNRLFLSKAVALWTGADDIDHAYTVGCYLHFCQGGFDIIQAKDLSTRTKGRERRIVGDPLYVVTATKK